MAPQFLLLSSPRNCLATTREHLPVPCSADKVVLSWRTPERSFSMKSANFPRTLRLHCFECSRSANLNEWEVPASFPLMFELSLLPTAIWRQPLPPEHFAPTSTTA